MKYDKVNFLDFIKDLIEQATTDYKVGGMIRRLVFFLTLTLLAFVFSFFLLQSSFFKIKDIEIVSNVSGSLESLKKKLDALKRRTCF